ncbi:hypothetical protein HYH03_006741 [Edaphochlamys debaryana]|uniref:Uncharacterized protein n=1 Tax=Edaphochlamys debaryana TaxID=47281 RepID=A0A836BZU2_9CHLO|nr:hypothetical protein HYH03_006741 [Edaphochlamys debaryana]|eukprot:KAG2495131.1 hypothetical protein HYH03_006741 [Edaphochlamys debaryana]
MSACDFVYAPPSTRLARRVEQAALLGAREEVPILISRLASALVLIGSEGKPSAGRDASPDGARDHLACVDGCTVRVAAGGGPSGGHTLSRAVTVAAAPVEAQVEVLAQAPLQSWLARGCHTSLVCLGLEPATSATAGLELLLSTSGPSILATCLKAGLAAASQSANAIPPGLTLGVYELRASPEQAASRAAGGVSAGRGRMERPVQPDAWADLLAAACDAIGPVRRGQAGPRPPAVSGAGAPSPSGLLAVGSLEEAVAVLHAAFGHSSLWRRPSYGARASETHATPVPPATDPLSPSFGDAHRPSGPDTATVSREATAGFEEEPPLLEPALDGAGAPPGGAMLLVRLGLPRPQQHVPTALGPGGAAAAAAAAFTNSPSWTTLDLVFVSCGATGAAVTRGIGGGAPRGSFHLARAPAPAVHSAEGCVCGLLAELIARQEDDTGIARPLRSLEPTGGPGSLSSGPGQACSLCRCLAPLLAGNVAPHLLAAVHIGLGPGEVERAREEGDGGAPRSLGGPLAALRLLAAAQSIRTVVVRSEPPPAVRVHCRTGAVSTPWAAPASDMAAYSAARGAGDSGMAAALVSWFEGEKRQARKAWRRAMEEAKAQAEAQAEAKAAAEAQAEAAAVAARALVAAHAAATEAAHEAGTGTGPAQGVEEEEEAAARVSSNAGASSSARVPSSRSGASAERKAPASSTSVHTPPPPFMPEEPQPSTEAPAAEGRAAKPPDADFKRGALVGGVARLQKRLEALQRARLIREGVLQPSPPKPPPGSRPSDPDTEPPAVHLPPVSAAEEQAGEGPAASASAAGLGLGLTAQPVAGVLDRQWADAAVSVAGSSLAGPSPAATELASRSRRAESPRGSSHAPAESASIQQGSAGQGQPARSATGATSGSVAAQHAAAAAAAEVEVAEAEAHAVAAASQRLQQLRSQFDRLYHGLVPEGTQVLAGDRPHLTRFSPSPEPGAGTVNAALPAWMGPGSEAREAARQAVGGRWPAAPARVPSHGPAPGLTGALLAGSAVGAMAQAASALCAPRAPQPTPRGESSRTVSDRPTEPSRLLSTPPPAGWGADRNAPPGLGLPPGSFRELQARRPEGWAGAGAGMGQGGRDGSAGEPRRPGAQHQAESSTGRDVVEGSWQHGQGGSGGPASLGQSDSGRGSGSGGSPGDGDAARGGGGYVSQWLRGSYEGCGPQQQLGGDGVEDGGMHGAEGGRPSDGGDSIVADSDGGGSGSDAESVPGAGGRSASKIGYAAMHARSSHAAAAERSASFGVEEEEVGSHTAAVASASGRDGWAAGGSGARSAADAGGPHAHTAAGDGSFHSHRKSKSSSGGGDGASGGGPFRSRISGGGSGSGSPGTSAAGERPDAAHRSSGGGSASGTTSLPPQPPVAIPYSTPSASWAPMVDGSDPPSPPLSLPTSSAPASASASPEDPRPAGSSVRFTPSQASGRAHSRRSAAESSLGFTCPLTVSSTTGAAFPSDTVGRLPRSVGGGSRGLDPGEVSSRAPVPDPHPLSASSSRGREELQRRNEALMGVLGRAAEGTEALQSRLYERQLEVLELRAVMEVMQAQHAQELAGLRGRLRGAAAAEAAAEDAAGPLAVAAVPAEGWAGAGAPTQMACGVRGVRAPGAAGRALEALVGAYEQQVEALQRQVAALVAGQEELAMRCAHQELAALAERAARRHRRRQQQLGGLSEHRAGGVTSRAGATGAALPLRRRHSLGGGLSSFPEAATTAGRGGARRGRAGSTSEESEDVDSGSDDDRWLLAPPDAEAVLRRAGGGLAGGVAGGGAAAKQWQQRREEMGALRSALRQSQKREAELRAALAEAQQQRRAALLAARVAAGEATKRRWLEVQAADLCRQLTAAREAAGAASVARDGAHREALRLRTEYDTLQQQLYDMQRLAASYAELAERSNTWMRVATGLPPPPRPPPSLPAIAEAPAHAASGATASTSLLMGAFSAFGPEDGRPGEAGVLRAVQQERSFVVARAGMVAGAGRGGEALASGKVLAASGQEMQKEMQAAHLLGVSVTGARPARATWSIQRNATLVTEPICSLSPARFELLTPYSKCSDDDQQQKHHDTYDLLSKVFKDNCNEVEAAVYAGRKRRDPSALLVAGDLTHDACQVAGLWVGEQLRCAAVLRTNVPGLRGEHRSSQPHVQIQFLATAAEHSRRGLGRLLTRCILARAAAAGHQYATVIVADRDVEGFWTKMGFLRKTAASDYHGLQVVDQSRAYALASGAPVWITRLVNQDPGPAASAPGAAVTQGVADAAAALAGAEIMLAADLQALLWAEMTAKQRAAWLVTQAAARVVSRYLEEGGAQAPQRAAGAEAAATAGASHAAAAAPSSAAAAAAAAVAPAVASPAPAQAAIAEPAAAVALAGRERGGAGRGAALKSRSGLGMAARRAARPRWAQAAAAAPVEAAEPGPRALPTAAATAAVAASFLETAHADATTPVKAAAPKCTEEAPAEVAALAAPVTPGAASAPGAEAAPSSAAEPGAMVAAPAAAASPADAEAVPASAAGHPRWRLAASMAAKLLTAFAPAAVAAPAAAGTPAAPTAPVVAAPASTAGAAAASGDPNGRPQAAAAPARTSAMAAEVAALGAATTPAAPAAHAAAASAAAAPDAAGPAVRGTGAAGPATPAPGPAGPALAAPGTAVPAATWPTAAAGSERHGGGAQSPATAPASMGDALRAEVLGGLTGARAAAGPSPARAAGQDDRAAASAASPKAAAAAPAAGPSTSADKPEPSSATASSGPSKAAASQGRDAAAAERGRSTAAADLRPDAAAASPGPSSVAASSNPKLTAASPRSPVTATSLGPEIAPAVPAPEAAPASPVPDMAAASEGPGAAATDRGPSSAAAPSAGTGDAVASPGPGTAAALSREGQIADQGALRRTALSALPAPQSVGPATPADAERNGGGNPSDEAPVTAAGDVPMAEALPDPGGAATVQAEAGAEADAEAPPEAATEVEASTAAAGAPVHGGSGAAPSQCPSSACLEASPESSSLDQGGEEVGQHARLAAYGQSLCQSIAFAGGSNGATATAAAATGEAGAEQGQRGAAQPTLGCTSEAAAGSAARATAAAAASPAPVVAPSSAAAPSERPEVVPLPVHEQPGMPGPASLRPGEAQVPRVTGAVGGHAGWGPAGWGYPRGGGRAGWGHAVWGYGGAGQAGWAYAGRGFAGRGYAGRGHAGLAGYVGGRGHTGDGGSLGDREEGPQEEMQDAADGAAAGASRGVKRRWAEAGGAGPGPTWTAQQSPAAGRRHTHADQADADGPSCPVEATDAPQAVGSDVQGTSSTDGGAAAEVRAALEAERKARCGAEAELLKERERVRQLTADLTAERQARYDADAAAKQLTAELTAERQARNIADVAAKQPTADLAAERQARYDADAAAKQLTADLAAERQARHRAATAAEQLTADLAAERQARHRAATAAEQLTADLAAERQARYRASTAAEQLTADLAAERQARYNADAAAKQLTADLTAEQQARHRAATAAEQLTADLAAERKTLCANATAADQQVRQLRGKLAAAREAYDRDVTATEQEAQQLALDLEASRKLSKRDARAADKRVRQLTAALAAVRDAYDRDVTAANQHAQQLKAQMEADRAAFHHRAMAFEHEIYYLRAELAEQQKRCRHAEAALAAADQRMAETDARSRPGPAAAAKAGAAEAERHAAVVAGTSAADDSRRVPSAGEGVAEAEQHAPAAAGNVLLRWIRGTVFPRS